MSEMKKRWIALYVENDVGVLAKVSGLFSGKSYNLQSLTVGTTEDETVSRMTISVESDDITFEQIKKQLNRMVEVIKVIDLTNVPLKLQIQIAGSFFPSIILFQQITAHLPVSRTKRIQTFRTHISVQQKRNHTLHRYGFTGSIGSSQ